MFQGIHKHGELNPEKMPSLSAACVRFLKSLPPPPFLSLDEIHRAQDGTIKLRLTGPESSKRAPQALEVVLIPGPRRVTLCVSSQIGCAAGCSFCRTGTMGLRRNLETWEMVEQVRLAKNFWRQKPAITNLVFMGMGEPLHNEANVVQACRILNHDLGAAFSKRHIMVSTVGVGKRLQAFWKEDVASLAISLHATTDELRNKLIPLNRRWNLATLRKSLLDIPWRRRETVTVAYLLLDGINDSRADAVRLVEWCRGLPAKINLLEFNPYPGSPFRRTDEGKLATFRQWLHDLGAFHTLRHSRGGDVLAACGQLAAGKND